ALQLIAQLPQPRRQGLLLFRRQARRGAEGDDPGHVLRPRADAELLATAVDDRLHRLAIADDQRPDALGSADLVARDGEECATDVAQRYRNLAECLNRVAVEQHAGLATSLGELPHRLHRPDLVVYPHHTDHGHAAVDRP